MATSSFEKVFEIKTVEAARRLIGVMESDPPAEPLSEPLFTKKDWERGEQLLRQCRLRSKR